MIKTPLFKRAFALLFLVGLCAVIADTFYLYSAYWWTDTLVHFFAAVTVATASISVWSFYTKSSLGVGKCIALGLFFTLIVGVLWESYELYFGIEKISDGMYYLVDTTSDLMLDTCGGIFGALYSHLVLNKNNV